MGDSLERDALVVLTRRGESAFERGLALVAEGRVEAATDEFEAAEDALVRAADAVRDASVRARGSAGGDDGAACGVVVPLFRDLAAVEKDPASVADLVSALDALAGGAGALACAARANDADWARQAHSAAMKAAREASSAGRALGVGAFEALRKADKAYSGLGSAEQALISAEWRGAAMPLRERAFTTLIPRAESAARLAREGRELAAELADTAL